MSEANKMFCNQSADLFPQIYTIPIKRASTFTCKARAALFRAVFLKLFQTKDHLTNKRNLTDHLTPQILKTIDLLTTPTVHYKLLSNNDSFRNSIVYSLIHCVSVATLMRGMVLLVLRHQ